MGGDGENASASCGRGALGGQKAALGKSRAVRQSQLCQGAKPGPRLPWKGTALKPNGDGAGERHGGVLSVS